MSQGNPTLNQLLDLYQQSRMKGEEASLSLETKDGKEFIRFSIGTPLNAGAPAGGPRRWPSRSKNKTPSQLRRDQRRKEVFLAKKSEKGSLDQGDGKIDNNIAEEELKVDGEATTDDTVTYELAFEAPNCSDTDIQECFDFNFKDEVRRKKLNIEGKAYEMNKKDSKLVVKKLGDTFKSLTTFQIKAKNKDEIKEAIEVFQVVWEFDNLGFKGSERDKKYATLREFKKI